MRPTALLYAALLLVAVTAKPNGHFHQQYEYHSSSSSFKNNELQHKKDDDSFYSKHGDLEGKVEPKVNSYSQHSEYTNPKLKSQQYGSQGYLNKYDTYGDSRYGAYNQKYGTSDYDRMSYSDRNYGVNSNLEGLTQRLNDDLSQQLNQALRKQFRQSSYSHSSWSDSQMNTDIQQLEEELKHNLTSKLQEALRDQYGQQTTRGSYSYSLADSTNPNYNNQELSDLTSEVEDNLLRQLREGVRTHYQSMQSSSSYSSSSGATKYNPYHHQVEAVPLNYNPNSHQTYTSTNSASESKTTQYNRPVYTNNYDTYYRMNTNLQSITDIASKVQNDLSNELNHILNEQERKFTQNSYHATNYDQILEQLKQELRYNLTRRLEEEMRNSYGNQIIRNSKYYTVQPSGTVSTTPNFRVDDLESLKQQVENNLIQKLTQGMRQQQTYAQTRRFSSSSSSSSSTSGSNTNSNANYIYRPTHYYKPINYQTNADQLGSHSNIRVESYGSTAQNRQYHDFNPHVPNTYVQKPAPLSSGSQTNENSYGYISSNRHSGHEINPSSNSDHELVDITRQLQDDLTRQLQSAIQRQTYSSSYSASSSASYNPSEYQNTLQRLTEELKRNLTRQLDESLAEHYGKQASRGSYSYSYSTGGSLNSNANYNNQKLSELTDQLQNDLIRQLEEGLQKNTYSKYSSYSSSSSSSSRAHRSQPVTSTSTNGGSNGQFTTYTLDEDCMQGDDNFHRNHDYHLTQQIQSPYAYINHYNRGDMQQHQNIFDDQQNTEELSQQVQDTPTSWSQTINEQNEGLTQQTEQNHQSEDFGKLQVGSQQKIQEQLENQSHDEGLTQQTEDFGKFYQQNHQSDDFGKLQVGSQQKIQEQSHDEGLSQQTEDGFEKLQIENQSTSDFSQQTQNTDDGQLHQQTEDVEGVVGLSQLQQQQTQQTEDFGKLQVASQTINNNNKHHHQDTEGLSQKTLNDDFGKSENSGHQQTGDYEQQQTQTGYGQIQSTDSGENLSQQTQSDFGKLEFNNNHQQTEDIGQTYQQTEDTYGKLQQQMDDIEKINQQTEDTYGKLQVGDQQLNQNTQQVEDVFGKTTNNFDGFTQQSEDGFGKLELANQNNDDFQKYESQYEQNQRQTIGQSHQETLQKAEKISDLSKNLNQQTEEINPNLDLQQTEQLDYSYSNGFKNQHENYNQQTSTNGHHGGFNYQSESNEHSASSSEEQTQKLVYSSPHSLGYQHHRSTYQSSQNQYEHRQHFSLDQTPQVHYASEQELDFSTPSILVEEPPKKQIAFVVGDTSKQATDTAPAPEIPQQETEGVSETKNVSPNKVSESDSSSENDSSPSEEEAVTEKPGFWKRVGNKISKAYTSVKDSAKALKDKIV